ncbi:UDP-N-acetylmuramyl peptide synthase [Bifidobacterium lemurum]|uniref:UDP-N-acetylmuramyl peptide synthase n=1 Tax=Bifidobacterium lemurum TaxID=1603886 RepID=A0A261FWE7_9BIFI|nr:hypothetical protein [Bifidobacterium lemurum]OZG63510.1 UDP-N-acetylmuramyl peptide synthase [Bifidobacterium lemurum]QOL34420.1 hypothetical protein BL8807_00280 [Bifidobacterium lemurum]
MSAVSEAGSQRLTLGGLAQRYGLDMEPGFIANVTVTSIADDVDSLSPGALYIARTPSAIASLPHAAQAGAYAALLPRSARGRSETEGGDLPLLFGTLDERRLGDLASAIAGNPSNSMAVFAIAGEDRHAIAADVAALSDLLHLLGNPVAVISADGSRSMERALDLSYPLGVLDMQRVLSVCAEDGVAAVIIALDPRTVAESGLESVTMDVLGVERASGQTSIEGLRSQYGFVVDEDMRLATPTSEARQLSLEAAMSNGRGVGEPLALAISMVLDAGVRRNNVRSALRVSRELR